MPCRYDPSPDEDFASMKKDDPEFQLLTRLACRYLQHLERVDKPIPKWAAVWWKHHKQADVLRRAKERAERVRRKQARVKEKETSKARQAALKKLTKAERIALGL